MKKIILFAIGFAVLVTAALLTFKNNSYKKSLQIINTEVVQPSLVPSAMVKPVSKDDSFTSIDSDLNNTVILNEDFSDLK